ncbi:hypothetical protein KJ866_04805 [Patescibacteria group bacterium]|nr:hypothetical protein [Patescibacteria group bacterium]MBU2037484.1 hypothetical protein [Patescibacteria group bacterium]MBU2219606.1 hypothetical protein [Patescibacteria group bacterium]MBU2264592.1 hypothetical protein [Patescibacteria group bacterium]
MINDNNQFNIEEKVKELFIKNRRTSGNYQYTLPSPGSYPYQWFWDSCFHAIILSHFDMKSAKEELRSLISKQFKNGLLPHIIYWEKHEVMNVDWDAEGTSSLAQPPLIAYAVKNIYKKENDISFVKEMFAPMDRYYRHLLTRDPRKSHLVGLINPDESGEDNSPRFDIPLGLEPTQRFSENNLKRFNLFEKSRKCGFDNVDCTRNLFWVKDVAFSAYLIENFVCMSELACEIKERESEAFYIGQREMMTKAMRERMYEDGIFWTIHGSNYEKIKVKTWAIFAPLIGGLYTEDEAKNLIKNHLRNEKEFWTPFIIPTTAKSETSYFPGERSGPVWLRPNWRGPIWIAPNWFVYRGLKKYGFHEEANIIREKSLELVEKSGFREYYHPETGQGLGAFDFTWGGLVLDME